MDNGFLFGLAVMTKILLLPTHYNYILLTDDIIYRVGIGTTHLNNKVLKVQYFL